MKIEFYFFCKNILRNLKLFKTINYDKFLKNVMLKDIFEVKKSYRKYKRFRSLLLLCLLEKTTYDELFRKCQKRKREV